MAFGTARPLRSAAHPRPVARRMGERRCTLPACGQLPRAWRHNGRRNAPQGPLILVIRNLRALSIPSDARRRRPKTMTNSRLSLLLLSALALLAGCASGPSGTRAPAERPTASSEERRLQDALRGTPVVVQTTAEGRLRVEVPGTFCFDAGRSAVKPPLAAVLDRVAPGLRNGAFDIRVAAPADAKGGGPLLVQDRAASIRDYLVARGVPVARFVALTPAAGDYVEVLTAQRRTP
jgi:outer membrane protein OmpA-like peptidoglycan-associated protein